MMMRSHYCLKILLFVWAVAFSSQACFGCSDLLLNCFLLEISLRHHYLTEILQFEFCPCRNCAGFTAEKNSSNFYCFLLSVICCHACFSLSFGLRTSEECIILIFVTNPIF